MCEIKQCAYSKPRQWMLAAATIFFIGVTASVPQLGIAAENILDTSQGFTGKTDRVIEELDAESTISGEEAESGTETPAIGGDKRITTGTTLFIDFVAQEDSESEVSPLIPVNKIFTVDASGYLSLPNIGRYKLSGLTESEAGLRLSAEAIFSQYDIGITVLPVELEGEEVLEVFGRSLFENDTTSDAEADVLVPVDYVLGPGDEIVIQLYGNENSTENLTVSREGTIDFPEIGPIAVAGQSVKEMRATLSGRVEQQLIGVKIYVTLGELRSIRVLVVGEVEAPGAYVVSSLSSVINVLSRSGGLTDIGSFRHIELKRGGRIAARVDLYELLLKGNLDSSARLQSNDVIFVPPVNKRVAISGEVKRPAIYEVDGEGSLEAVLALAGGLKASAYTKSIMIERVTTNNQRVLLEADLSSSAGRNRKIKDGDQITVSSVGTEVDGSVQLLGHVLRPGSYAWSEGLTITDIIPSVRLLKKKPDLNYVLIKRQREGVRDVDVFSVKLAGALRQKNGPLDIALRPDDEIYVFGFSAVGQRQHMLSAVIETLKRQATMHAPAKVVSIEGGVFESGSYPLAAGMRVSDLVRAAGSLTESASGQAAELTRIVRDSDNKRSYQHIKVRLDQVLAGNKDADLLLQSYDSLMIKADPRWAVQNTVEITGEVRFPGVYPIARGEQISSLIERAGGLTDIAFADGAVLSRTSVKESEGEEMADLAERLEMGLKATILERADESFRPSESLQVATEVIDILRNAEPVGRVVMNLPKILAESTDGRVSDADVILFDEDTVHIPAFKQAVAVIGEVNHPTSHIYDRRFSMMDYVEKSGGLTTKTKDKLAFVIRADGSAMPKGAWWNKGEIKPGDTVVVPLDVERIRTLKKWGEIAAIFGNLVTPAATAVNAAAAWKTAEAAETTAKAIESRGDGVIVLP